MSPSLRPRHLVAVFLAAGLLLSTSARADLRVGVILSLTGPGASLGIPAQNTVKLWPNEIAGQKVIVTVLNDETDPVTAAKTASRLLNEDKVDVIVGPSLTPTSLAVVEQAARASTPDHRHGRRRRHRAAAGRAPHLGFQDDRPRERSQSASTIDDMLANNVKTVATIGIGDELRRRLPQVLRGLGTARAASRSSRPRSTTRPTLA